MCGPPPPSFQRSRGYKREIHRHYLQRYQWTEHWWWWGVGRPSFPFQCVRSSYPPSNAFRELRMDTRGTCIGTISSATFELHVPAPKLEARDVCNCPENMNISIKDSRLLNRSVESLSCLVIYVRSSKSHWRLSPFIPISCGFGLSRL